MIILFMFILLLYFLIKFNSSKIDIPKIRHELSLASKEATEERPKNQMIIQTYSDVKKSMSLQMNDIRNKENLSEENLITIGKAMKIMTETARKMNAPMFPQTRAGSTYAFLLFAEEIIAIGHNRDSLLQHIISISEEIIDLSFYNTSDNLIYERFQQLKKIETELNNLTKNMYFKMNCVEDLRN